MTLTEDDRDKIVGIVIRREIMLKDMAFYRRGERCMLFFSISILCMAVFMFGIMFGKLL